MEEQNKGEGCFIWGAFVVFFGLGIFLIVWNTYRMAKNEDQIRFAEEKALKVNFNNYDPSLDGELVLLAGPISTENTFRDETYGIEFKGINYVRNVAIFTETEEDAYFVSQHQYSNADFNDLRYFKEAYNTASLKLKADSSIYVGEYRIDTALLRSDDLYKEPILVENNMKLGVGKNRFYKVDINLITDSKDFNNPQPEDLEIEFFGLSEGSNLTVLGLQKDGAIVKPEGEIPFGAIRGYRDASAILKDLNKDEWEVNWNFRVFGIMALFVGSLAFRYLIRNFLFRITNENLPRLRGHIFFTSVALCAFAYWVLDGLGFVFFGQHFLTASIALGKATALAFIFIIINKQAKPGFLFKESVPEVE